MDCCFVIRRKNSLCTFDFRIQALNIAKVSLFKITLSITKRYYLKKKFFVGCNYMFRRMFNGLNDKVFYLVANFKFSTLIFDIQKM